MTEKTNEDLAFELNLSFNKTHLEMREYAFKNNVPIIEDSGLAFVETLIKVKQPKNILEIGTAIGYSSSRFSLVADSHVTTIERDEKMEEEARKNIKNLGLETKVRLIESDALDAFNLVNDRLYDIIFIDAAKAQYQKFFELYVPLLNKGGIIITDNMFFHGLIFDNISDKSRNLRQLVRKLKGYHSFLLENPDFNTKVFNIGDGIAVTFKNE